MDHIEAYKTVDRFYVPRWLSEQIQAANFDLVDHMKWMLLEDDRLKEVFSVDRSEIEHLNHNQGSLRNLLRAPFLMVAPTLQSVEDWRCFIDGTPTTVAVDQLRSKMPDLGSLPRFSMPFYNRMFVDLITAVINMSALCAPLLGITTDLAQYLGSVERYKLGIALTRMRDLPLFRWRFNSPTFWFEFTADSLTDESIAHHIMRTSPIKPGSLPGTAAWGELRLERTRNEMYAAAMMAHGFRASTAASLFSLNQNQMRRLYRKIHGNSSPCGNNATSLPWFVETPQQRLHSTTYVWLYRSAVAMGANPPEGLIATNDIYGRLFGGNKLISADRGCHLTRSMAAEARLTLAPCRSCGTHYIASNNDTKIEVHGRFVCPACNQLLGPKKTGRKKVNRADT